MAKDQFSFDIVSEVSMPEVSNAVDQAGRELAQRFDFKNTQTGISQDATLIEVRSSTEDRLKAAVDVLKDKVVKRGISLKAISEGPVDARYPGPALPNLQVSHLEPGAVQDLVDRALACSPTHPRSWQSPV